MNTAFMRIVKQSEFVLRKHAPTILTGVGVTGFVATTAFTIRATARAMEAMPELSKRIQNAKDKSLLETADVEDVKEVAKVRSQELARAYLTNGVELAKIYAPTITLGSASILCVLAGHNMMLKRQASVVALYAALDSSFRAYRGRVAEKIGREEEVQLYRNPRIIVDAHIDDGDGQDPACIIDVLDVNPSPYAKFFDETNVNWHKNPEYNLFFLTQTERWANDRLNAYGYLYLNEVYAALGLDRTQAGQIVGWRKKSEDGDGFVSFGIHDLWDDNKRAFVNGMESNVLLDFNVDGIIRI